MACPFLQSTLAVPPRQVSAEQEFANIRSQYPSLSSTGCTAKFCQSGRMTHMDEERVGRNQSYTQVREDALDFLQQMHRDGLIDTEQLHSRAHDVLQEIQKNSTEGKFTAASESGPEAAPATTVGLVGGLWTQTFEELEFGLRTAWKHARKCIMRSEYSNLRLCDLRHVRTSKKMAETLIENLRVAYNSGEINPTVFVFPPRDINSRGPMIWNSQLLSFAGYEQSNGEILGDPANVELTKAIIELGWTPPRFRSQWDLLPIVTMAEGEEPVITELPKDAFPLVHIRHPKYPELETLGLRWVPAPALSRLGFSIGGVQYTATPFIGWFMDAEIGVRNLADSFRYNALPQVAKVIGLVDGNVDDLPDYERLAVLSRAQLELNYATYWSFAQAGVRMSDSLGAAEQFAQFDDEHLMNNGFRLPSDPYWLAPPQGSIIPLWHRGGSPNYQPKPLICRHAQDPVKAWRRERQFRSTRTQNASDTKLNILIPVPSISLTRPVTPVSPFGTASTTFLPVPPPTQTTRPSTPLTPLSPRGPGRRIYIGFCSSGNVAIKLCKRLCAQLQHACDVNPELGSVVVPCTLNALPISMVEPDDVLVIVASTTGRGEVPQNGKAFADALARNPKVIACRYAIFANGSLEYPDTYNQAAMDIEDLLSRGDAQRLIGMREADTGAENPPWSVLGQFFDQVLAALQKSSREAAEGGDGGDTQRNARPVRPFDTRPWFQASVVGRPAEGTAAGGMKRVTLDMGEREYPTMGSVWILPPNSNNKVSRVLGALGVEADERLDIPGEPTVGDFLQRYADLEQPFKSTAWAEQLSLSRLETLSKAAIEDAVHQIPSGWRQSVTLDTLCGAMPTIQPREYSIASDGSRTKREDGRNTLDLLVQHHPEGRFSDRYLGCFEAFGAVTCKIRPSSHLRGIAENHDRPMIIFTTGSGMAPVRGLLQNRLQRLRSPDGNAMPAISLFAGFKASDESLVREAVHEADEAGIFDVLRLTGSNREKRRAQDAMLEAGVREKLARSVEDGALVFACARPRAVDDFLGALSKVLGCDAREALGDRFVADVYQPAT
ncbi:nitric oxide synthase [Colletotrichum higginsianum]|uniref:nitric-oxide synthase (NADPH) n=1 Tax=Colletotrichum higginsianum (strain IMI 349063) TaxID=759273 RepID=H1V3R5_COLHI|nr:Nitric oxide synthase [Colletotrichum higginsianum IMI 349063]OBR14863.1 Nitric oxide synthase [Colletotrichum higginsianum IMI 349063]CCF34867.1 nitric oxide synthase [Colletotrichum higginsianum]